MFLYFEVVAVSILFFLCKSVKKLILSHFAFIFSHKNRKISCIILECVSYKLSIDILGVCVGYRYLFLSSVIDFVDVIWDHVHL